MYARDGDIIREKGILHGFDTLAYAVVMNQAFGGLLVAVVIKYADNIIKGKNFQPNHWVEKTSNHKPCFKYEIIVFLRRAQDREMKLDHCPQLDPIVC